MNAHKAILPKPKDFKIWICGSFLLHPEIPYGEMQAWSNWKACCFKHGYYLYSSLIYVSEPAEIHLKKLKAAVNEDKVKLSLLISFPLSFPFTSNSAHTHTHIYIAYSIR